MLKNNKIYFLAIGISVLIFSYFAIIRQAPTSNLPIVRSEVFGEVAPGKIYTTLINMNEFEPNLNASIPYVLEMSATGSELYKNKVSDIAIDYQPLGDNLYSVGVFSGDTPRKDGYYQMLDSERKKLGILKIQDNPNTDAHGITRLKNGNFIVPSYRLYKNDNGTYLESFVIEEQTMAGEVVFTWNSLDHVPLEEANFKELRQYWLNEKINDYFHGNAVAEANDGNLLISARHTNCIYKIDRKTGEVIWRLGGLNSDFTFIDDPQNGFSHQHSIHQLPNGNILLYDNGNLHEPAITRVSEYQLDENSMTAKLVWSYSDGRFTYATGSVQRLKNGNTLIGWGLELNSLKNDVPRITEIDSTGKVVMNIYFPENSGLYNVFKEE